MANGTSSSAETGHWGELRRHKEEIVDVRREIARRSGRLARFSDRLGQWLGHPAFLVALAVTHLGWMLWNSGWLGLPRWDPPPFRWLAMIASVEAPFLTVLILMHQRRQQRVAELREELDVQIALHSERQSTRLVQMVADMHAAMGLDPAQHDEDLETMKEPLSPEQVTDELQDSLEEDEQ